MNGIILLFSAADDISSSLFEGKGGGTKGEAGNYRNWIISWKTGRVQSPEPKVRRGGPLLSIWEPSSTS